MTSVKKKSRAKKFDNALSDVRIAAKKAGLTEQKIDDAVKAIRKSSRRSVRTS